MFKRHQTPLLAASSPNHNRLKYRCLLIQIPKNLHPVFQPEYKTMNLCEFHGCFTQPHVLIQSICCFKSSKSRRSTTSVWAPGCRNTFSWNAPPRARSRRRFSGELGMGRYRIHAPSMASYQVIPRWVYGRFII